VLALPVINCTVYASLLLLAFTVAAADDDAFSALYGVKENSVCCWRIILNHFNPDPYGCKNSLGVYTV
jgi:hypothetical protein